MNYCQNLQFNFDAVFVRFDKLIIGSVICVQECQMWYRAIAGEAGRAGAQGASAEPSPGGSFVGLLDRF